MYLMLTAEESERLRQALRVAECDELEAQEWLAALAAAVGRLLRARTGILVETADGAHLAGDAVAGAALAGHGAHEMRDPREAHDPRGDGGGSHPPPSVWSVAAGGSPSAAAPAEVVGMTAHAGEGGARMSVACLTPPPAGRGAAGRCAALLRLLYPVFEAAVSRRSAVGRAVPPSTARRRAAAEGPSVPVRDDDAAAAALRRRYHLTPREADVTQLLLRGRSNGEVARALGISDHTARHHTERVFTKVDVRSRAALWPAAFEPAAPPAERDDRRDDDGAPERLAAPGPRPSSASAHGAR